MLLAKSGETGYLAIAAALCKAHLLPNCKESVAAYIEVRRTLETETESLMNSRRNILILPYVFAIILYLIGPVTFSRIYLEAIIWFGLILTMLKISAMFGQRNAAHHLVAKPSSDDLVIVYFKLMSVPIFAGAAYYVIWLYSQGTSLDMVMLNTGEVREMTAGSDLSKKIAAILAYQAYAYIPVLLTNWRHRFPFYINAIMAGAIALMALAVVLQAGRTFFLVAAALAGATYMVTLGAARRADFRRKAWYSNILLYVGVGFVAIAGGVAIYIIGVQRVSSMEIATVLHSAEYRYLGDWIKSESPSTAYFSTVIFHYLVGPWSNLNIAILAETDFARWSAGPFEVISARFTDRYDVGYAGTSLESYKRYLMLGGQPSGWRTGFGNILQWYGFLGMVIYAVFIGYVTGNLMYRAKNSQSLLAFLKAVWAVAFFLMCLFYFPSDTLFWVNLTLVFVVLPTLVAVLTPRRLPARTHRQYGAGRVAPVRAAMQSPPQSVMKADRGRDSTKA